MEFTGYHETSTAHKVIQALQEGGFIPEGIEPTWIEPSEETDGGWNFRFNAPWRENSNSLGCSLTIHDDVGEYGTIQDFVDDEFNGSLYTLAKELGVEVENKQPARKIKAFTGIVEYAADKNLPPDPFVKASWTEGVRFCPKLQRERPCLLFPTKNGTRIRFIDGHKPKYGNPKGYKGCWYGLARAVQIAKETDKPLMIGNGEPTVISGQYWKLPVAATTNGSEKKAFTREFLEELKTLYPEGPIWVVLDCDKHGRAKSPALAAQLRREGYDAISIDLGYSDGFDLADFGALHQWNVYDQLLILANEAKKIQEAASKEVEEESKENPSLLSPVAIERSTLAILMFHSHKIASLGEAWSDTWYSNEAHHIMAQTLRKMSVRGELIDHNTLWQRLCEMNKSSLFGSQKALMNWRDEGVDADPLNEYLKIIEEATIRRQWLQTTFALQRAARDANVPVEELGRKAEQSLVTTTMRSDKPTRLVSIAEALDAQWETFGDDSTSVVYTNIGPLDKALQGIAKGECIQTAGRPGGGKTALEAQIALEFALQDIPAVFFSQEVERNEITARLVAAAIESPRFRKRFPELGRVASIPYSYIIKKNLDEDQLSAWIAVSQLLNQLPIWIPFGKASLATIKHECKLVHEMTGKLIVPFIDYLQFMERPNSKMELNEAIGENAYGLKELAGTDYVHHVHMLSQMNRGIESRNGEDSRMSDAEGSGKIEQASTTMLNLLPIKRRDGEEPVRISELFIDIPKARNGQTGIIKLGYAKAYNFFCELEDENETWTEPEGYN